MLISAIHIKADYYHCHDIGPMVPAWLAARITKSRLIYDSHELEYDRNFSRPIRIFYRYYEKLFLNKSDHIIISDGKFRSRVLIDKNKCKVPMTYVFNCQPLINPSECNRHKLKRELGYSENTKIIVYVGGYLPNRGIENTLAAISQINDTIMVLVGHYSISQISHWEQIFRLKNRIKVIGPFHYSDVVKIISGADLGIVLIQNTCLSYYYSTPTKLFDYIAAGIPVITSNFPAMQDIVINNVYGAIGICVDPLGTKELVTGIKKLISKKNRESVELHRNINRLFLNKYNWESQEKKLLNVYDNLK